VESSGTQSWSALLQADADRRVTVAVFGQPHEAHLARLRLEAEGIESEVHGEHMGGLAWPPAAGIELRVRRWQEDLARQVLAECEPRASSADWVTADLDAPRCPRCGSLRVRPALAAGGGWLARTLALPFARRRADCRHCGHRWNAA
jgi:DNA-directed RNA polymerase subunit RPC12/RpoP